MGQHSLTDLFSFIGGGKGGKGGSNSNWMGCLGYSSDQLENNWIFEGDAPSCSYMHHRGKGGKGGGKGRKSGSWWWGGDDDNGGSNGGSSGGGSGGSSNGGSSGGSSGGNGGGNGGDGGGNDDNGNDAETKDGEKDESGYANGGDDDLYATDDDDVDQEYTNEDFDDIESDDDSVNYNDGNAGGDGDDNVANDDGQNDDGTGDDNVANDDGNGGGDADDDVANDDAADDDGSDNSMDPEQDFDIEVCDTFENLWMWDLSLTCESEDSLDSCECVWAEELIEDGFLTCQDMAQRCPIECQICATCAQLMGCNAGTLGSIVARPPFYLFVAAAGAFLIGLAYYYSRRRRRRDDDSLAAQLLDAQNMDSPPSSPKEPTVWLAPDVGAMESISDSLDDSAHMDAMPPSMLAARSHSTEIPLTKINADDSDIISDPTMDSDQHVWLAPDVSDEQVMKVTVPSFDGVSSVHSQTSQISVKSQALLTGIGTDPYDADGSKDDEGSERIWLAPDMPASSDGTDTEAMEESIRQRESVIESNDTLNENSSKENQDGVWLAPVV